MKTKKLNVIDFILVLTLILVVAAVTLRAINTNRAKEAFKDKEIVYTVELYGLDSRYVSAVKSGDSIYIADKALFCGTAENVISKYASQDVLYTNGEIKSHINPSTVDLTVDIRVSADVGENGFFIGENTYITTGSQLNMYTSTFSFSGKITNIEIKA